MKYLFILICFLLVIYANNQYSQSDSSSGVFNNLPHGLKIIGYIDTYYATDDDEGNYLRQFSAICPYRDDFKINFLSLAFRYNTDKFRGNAVIHFGDVPNVNWPTEDRYIQEANIGFQAFKNFWIDAGYFIAHIGGEGLIPKYNPLTIISLCTTLEPWYQSGIRFSYDFSDKLSAQLHIVNSFNVFTDTHKHKSAGIQLDYHPNEKFDITYNNLLGNENTPPDNQQRFRFYNNLVIKINPTKKVNLIFTGDYCLQAKSKLPNLNSNANLYSGFATIKYYFAKKFSVAGRAEYYIDKDGILSGIFNVNNQQVGLNAYGFTAGIEYNPVEFGFIRLESRYLKADNKVFYNGTDNRFEEVITFGAEL